MPLPKPVPGLVLRYSYLWHREHLKGQEEGVKDRPCAVVMVVGPNGDGQQVVVVLPITHSPPSGELLALEIPQETKLRLGLDSQKSWVVLSEANRFVWPGPDLRAGETGDAGSVAYGLLPRVFYTKVRNAFDTAIATKLAHVVPRSQ